jgi:P-type Ca2+ transporter type 2C
MEFFNKNKQQVITELDSSPQGLDLVEVETRQRQYGLNRLSSPPAPSLFSLFVKQFKDFIVYILLFAIFFSLLIGEYVDSIIILAILLLNGIIGFFQEFSANRSLNALKKMIRIQSLVLRDGKQFTVLAEELVPGDIILLENGDKIPADARLIRTVSLQVDESALTGESLPVRKEDGLLPESTPISDQLNMVFASTAVVAGRATAVVTATAMNTEIGKISRLIQESKEGLTPLQRRLERFGKRLGAVIIAICTVILFTLIVRQFLSTEAITISYFQEIAFIAISLAVAAVPTALPAVVTITLAVGVKRLLAKRCLVRRLAAVESLGSCDIICSDKTGTLTKNEMTIVHAWSLDGESLLSGSGYSPQGMVEGEAAPLLYEIGMVCNNAKLEELEDRWQIVGDPTEGALLVSGAKADVDFKGERLEELPFDSSRKCMSVLLEKSDELIMYSKGAPDDLLARCNFILLGGTAVVLNKELRQKVLNAYDQYASQAMRVLAMAYKEIEHRSEFTEEALVFVGLQAMIDPPRPDVAESVLRAKRAHIRSIMITGDYPKTARAVATSVGIEGEMLTGSQMDMLSDQELSQALQQDTNIFARVVPEHKLRIVQVLRADGHVVAMTGDGVNDAPALKHADIGVAVGSGTEVAKEAADFILLDDSFAHIVDAVEQGRGIYDNIQKSIMLLLSGNLGEVLIIFFAVVTGMNLPLTAVLLLWINMITDGAPALAYSIDPYSGEIMQRPPIPLTEGILPKARLLLLFFLGIAGTGIALTIFVNTGGDSSNGEQLMHGRTMVFNFIVLYEMMLVFLIRRSYHVAFLANPLLWGAVLLTFALQALILYTPLASVFQVVPPNRDDMLVLGLGGFCFFMAYLLYYYIPWGALFKSSKNGNKL